MPSNQFRPRSGPGSDDASRALSIALNKWFSDYGANDIFRTCASCRYMDEKGPAFCKKYQMTPPASVIVSACPAHDDVAEIPF